MISKHDKWKKLEIGDFLIKLKSFIIISILLCPK